MKKIFLAVLSVLIISSCAFAGVTSVNFDPVAAGYQVVDSLQETFIGPNLNDVNVQSVAYHNSTTGKYVYLYQILNGETQPIDEFTIFDFKDISVADMGYVSNAPAGFVTAGAPSDASDTDGNATFTFSSAAIGFNANSAVLYIESDFGPATLGAKVSGADWARGNVIAPSNVPEPATLSFLAIGGVILARKRRK